MTIHPYTRLLVLPAPPDADNDTTEGYELGDVVHVTGGGVYDCRDAAEGAAVWEERTGGSYTDEEAQDAIGAMVDTTLEYVDATPLLRRAALTGDVTAAAGSNATTVTNASVIAKVLTAFAAGAGTVSSSDSILEAFQKVVGNIALKLTANAAITGATKTKITYDANGLVTAGADLAASDLPTGIDAAKLSSGAVSNTEFDYLNGVTSAIQAQIDAKASTAYVDALIGANDAMVYKGVIDCSANPNYPAADAGHLYKVSVAGKIGGASGPNVEVGDSILCSADSTASGNHATVGSSWSIIQVNIDGAVTGPASSTSGNIATFNGTGGKVIQDGGATVASLGMAAQIVAAAQEDSINVNDLFAYRQTSGGVLKKTPWSNVLNIFGDLFSSAAHNHDGGDTVQLAQANTHESPDTDSGASSLHHTIGGGANQAAAGNHAVHTPAGIGSIPNDGWVAYSAVIPTRTASDDPTYTIQFAGVDLRTLFSEGCPIKWVQNSIVRYGWLSSDPAFSTNTTVTVLTRCNDANANYDVLDTATFAISDFYYAPPKQPGVGFPVDDDYWTVTSSNTANAHKTPPTQNVWYGGAGLTNTGPSVDMPIGSWRGKAKAVFESEDTTVTDFNCYATISTANNSESDSSGKKTIFVALTTPSGTYKIWSVIIIPFFMKVAAKTTLYLNIKTSTTTCDAIHMRGDVVPSTFELVTAYL